MKNLRILVEDLFPSAVSEAGLRYGAALAGLVAAACGYSPVANRAPVVTDDLTGADVFVGYSLTVDLAGHFEDPDGDDLRYEAESSAPAEAGVAVAGSVLTVTALAWGEAAVTVKAHDPGGLTADQEFMVTLAPVIRRLPKYGWGNWDMSPAWSPDGTRIAFSSPNDRSFEVCVFDSDGSDLERLTNNNAADVDPAWSPDGARIAFASTRDGNVEIYAVNADGTDAERLTNNSGIDREPAWSPDGARIAFASDRDGNREIYVVNADGSDVERLTNNSGFDGQPAWSPDGTEIAFASDRDGSLEIYVMNADGSDVERLTNNGATDFSPTWSPDGARIAFMSNRDAERGERYVWEIYVMNADGSDAERLTNNGDGARDPAWSPDGTEIAFWSERSAAIHVAYIAVR